MIDLYAAGTSNGMRARIALEECGLPYQFHPVNLDKGEHKTPQFMAMNPNGQIPVIVDHEGPGGKQITLAQSTAILLYCAEKCGKFHPRDPLVMQALMSASTDITPTLGAFFAAVRSKEPHAPTVEMFRGRLRGYLQVWDGALAKQKYCAGSEVTVADLSLYAGVARTRGMAPEVLEGLKHLERWAGAMGARPAIQRALTF